MTQPLFFEPYDDIEDSDLLGIGDLIYEDGRREYVADPELAGMLQRPPSANDGVGMAPLLQPGMYTPEQLAGPPPTLDTPQGPMTVTPQGFEPVPAIDPSMRPDVQPAGPMVEQGNSFRPEGSLPGLGANEGEPLDMGPSMRDPSVPPPLLDPSSGYTPEQLAGPPPTIETAQGPMQVTPQGMVPVGREGALPPDVAAEQLGQLGAQQQQTLQASEQARAEESRLMQEYTAQRMAEVEAEKQQREDEIAEQQAKVERWNGERQQLADMDIETDLISARGPIGALFGVLGAALLGAVGSDAGLRMIDKSIDTHVRQQVNRRDTKLGLLAEQIQSTQQAMALGKSKLYEALANRAELMAQKTKNDIYEAQTPAIIESLRQKQLEEMQKAEQESLGKLIERVPERAKPPNPAMAKEYGALRRERDASADMVERMENQAGLTWQPGKNGQPGFYANRDEVIKNGIQGIGAIEQWIPDFVYSTFGQKEGYQVRGAKQALAFAAVRAMQPTGIITDVDRKVGEMSATMDTEEGLIQTLERLRNSEEEQRFNDAAQFGENVVGEYERQYQRSGGQQLGTAGPARPAGLEDIQGERQRRQRPQGQPASAAPQGPTSSAADIPPEERMAMLSESLTSLSQEKGIPPEGVAILLAQSRHETGNGKHMPANNYFGMKSTGRNRARGAGSANLETTEGAGGDAKRVRQDFATFDSADDASTDMLSLLERKYPRALEALRAGDEAAYVAALKDGGYFTGDEAAYLRSIQRML